MAGSLPSPTLIAGMVEKLPRERLVGVVLNDQPGGRVAALAGTLEFVGGHLFRGAPQVGVGEDHHRRVAAKLEHAALQVRRGLRGELPAHPLGGGKVSRKASYQLPQSSRRLGVGDWECVGAWDLELGI